MLADGDHGVRGARPVGPVARPRRAVRRDHRVLGRRGGLRGTVGPGHLHAGAVRGRTPARAWCPGPRVRRDGGSPAHGRGQGRPALAIRAGPADHGGSVATACAALGLVAAMETNSVIGPVQASGLIYVLGVAVALRILVNQLRSTQAHPRRPGRAGGEGGCPPRDRQGAGAPPTGQRDAARIGGAPAPGVRGGRGRHRGARPQGRDRSGQRRILQHAGPAPGHGRGPALGRARRRDRGRRVLRHAPHDRAGDAAPGRERQLPRGPDLGDPGRPAEAAAART